MRNSGAIEVIDLLERVMRSVPVGDETTHVIDLGGLPNGVYLLMLPTIDGGVMRRVTVMH